jgi:hypothetical protein
LPWLRFSTDCSGSPAPPRLNKLCLNGSAFEPRGAAGDHPGQAAGVFPMSDHSENVPADDPEAGDTLAGDLEKLLREQLDELEELVREHPLATVGIAAGAGLIAALILSRR